MTTYRYLSNSEDPSIPLRWLTNAGAVIDLSAATWSLKLLSRTGTTLLTKTSSITGYAALQGTSPNDYNCLITWATGELATSGVSGNTFSVRDGTLVLQHTISSRQSEPFNGSLTIVVEDAPS